MGFMRVMDYRKVDQTFVQQLVKVNNKENIKAQIYCPFVRRNHRWPVDSLTKGRYYEKRLYALHYNDVIMGAITSQFTSLTIVYWTVNSGADQRNHQSPASLAFVRGIHWWPVNSPHKWPVTRKMFPFDDVIMGDAIGWPTTNLCPLGFVVICTHSPRKIALIVFIETWINVCFLNVSFKRH